MRDYGGEVRSETLLSAGLTHLERLKKKVCSSLAAANPHELMRCLEVLNMLDMGEVVVAAARERKETRGKHVRPDYLFTNPLPDQLLVVKKVNERPVIEWRPIAPK